MKSQLTRLLPMLLLCLAISSCKKDDGNPTSGTGTKLEGTWKTNGIYEYSIGRGVNWTLQFTGTNICGQSSSYKEDSTGAWILESQSSGTSCQGYQLDNSFIVFRDNSGLVAFVLHYAIVGNKLTLHNTADHGGIYAGSSNNLTGSFWAYTYVYYTTYNGNNVRVTVTRQYFHNIDGTGMQIYRSNRPDGAQNDTTRFTYSASGNELTFWWENSSNPYFGIYGISNNRLYLYGKPGAGVSDEYYTWELFKQ